MTHITTWILAVTLTGSPVTTALCATVCGHASAPAAHCHESLTEPAPTAMSGETLCVATTGEFAYINNDAAKPQAAAVPAGISPAPTIVATPTARHIAVRAMSRGPDRPLVLRI